MSVLFEKKSGEYMYQELPSGIVIAKHQIALPESNFMVSTKNILSSENTFITCAKDNGFIETPEIVIANSTFELRKYNMVKGR